MMMMFAPLCLLLFALTLTNAYHTFPFKSEVFCKAVKSRRSALFMADVEVVFPNKKKAKVPSGSAFKDAAKKAGYSPNYGCEEGKCGSCELKMNGKQKARPCIAKVNNYALASS
jgi:ferredoxin